MVNILSRNGERRMCPPSTVSQNVCGHDPTKDTAMSSIKTRFKVRAIRPSKSLPGQREAIHTKVLMDTEMPTKTIAMVGSR